MLTVAEPGRLLEVAVSASDRLEGVFVVALAPGLRRGEVLGLKWEDVDVDRRLLRVARAVQRVDGLARVVEPKTCRSRPVLPMPAMVVAVFERQRARQAADGLRAGQVWQDLGFVFASVIGTPLEPRNVNRRFSELSSDLAVGGICGCNAPFGTLARVVEDRVCAVTRWWRRGDLNP